MHLERVTPASAVEEQRFHGSGIDDLSGCLTANGANYVAEQPPALGETAQGVSHWRSSTLIVEDDLAGGAVRLDGKIKRDAIERIRGIAHPEDV